MSMTSKWSVAAEHDVRGDDVEADGTIADAAVDRWATDAAAAYLQQCLRLEERRAAAGLELRSRVGAHAGGARLGSDSTVVVTATATEVQPQAFVIAVRLRPVGTASSDPVDLTCEIRLEDPETGVPHDIDNEIRDELIALEHAARHFN
jgi:hypothetical protein